MPLLRFATVGAVFEAFPSARDDVEAPVNGDDDPLTVVRRLAAEQSWSSVVSLCAYLLPRREAVWWGCQSLRAIRPQLAPAETAAMEAAEAWVRNPEDGLRREALKLGMMGDGRLPGIWMALAAGWSGGSIVPPEFGMMPAGPQQTARGIRAGVLIALTQVQTDDIPGLIGPCLTQFETLAKRQVNAD